MFLSANQSVTFQRRRKKHNASKRAEKRPSTWQPLQVKASPHDDRMAAFRAIPSADFHTSAGSTGRKDSPVYTGTYVKGIAQTHKSNAVPVVDDQHIIDIARMRR